MAMSDTSITLEEKDQYSNGVILIDGMWGSGKSMIMPLVSGLSEVDNACLDNSLELAAIFYRLGKLDEDAAMWMIRSRVDMRSFYSSIGREINLRWSDASGFKNCSDKLATLYRLFRGEESALREFHSGKVMLPIMTHNMAFTGSILRKSLRERLKVIEIVRHPLYMVEHVRSYLARFSGPREFNPSFDCNGQRIPWFMTGGEDEFVKGDLLEKAVLTVCYLSKQTNNAVMDLGKGDTGVLVVPFEDVAINTEEVIRKLEVFTGKKRGKEMIKAMKRQRLPRKVLMDGKGFSRNGWVRSLESEEHTYKKLISKIKDSCRAKYFDILVEAIDEYNSKYPTHLARYRDEK